MAHNTAPSGRSPYPPSRSSRRRLSTEPPPNPEESSTSPLFMGGGGHGLLRVSPSTTAHWSPAISGSAVNNNNNNHNHHPSSARRPRRFFDNPPANVEASVAGSQSYRLNRLSHDENPTAQPYPEDAGDNNNRDDDKNDDSIDGIHIKKLRSLTKEALGTPSVASLPSTAVFYASLLYAKTQLQGDCFLYAQALARNGEAKRCVRILEQSGILDPPGSNVHLRLEAVLLAAEALSTLGEWQSVAELLEDTSQVIVTGDTSTHSYAHHQYSVEDDDDMAWDALFQSVDQSNCYLHPVSRLCLWRGRAYSETGHPQRAAIYWKRAIRMDSKCVQALDFLLARSVVTPQEAYEVIESLNFDEDMEWLRHLYLARIELSPQDIPDVPSQHLNDESHFSTQLDINMQQIHSETPFATEGHSQYLDASSIQMASPSMIHTPRGDIMPTGPNFHSVFGDTATKTNNDAAKLVNGGTDQKPSARSQIQVDVDEAFAQLWHVHKLHQSPEVLAMAARRAYRRYDLKGALQHCQRLATIDPLCQTAGYVYISTLAALGHKRHLFRLAHEWVEASPKSARAWFAVGSYYYACERYHVAQRHFCRATRLDPHCTEAWIAFGCSFAACDESDQALASFRAAQRLSPGEYASLLYMGMEYLRTNHLVLAQYFLSAAYKTSGGDPLCLNELGVLSIQRSDYESAIQWFSRALRACVQDQIKGDEQKSVAECIELCQEKLWESTIFNLGQCYRKTRKFSEAARCFERCIALSPEKCSGYAALAFTKHLMGDLDDAIEFYHQALSCKPDDPFSSEMLNKALQEALSTDFTMGEDENNKPAHDKQHNFLPTSSGCVSYLSKNRSMGQDQTFLSNNTNTSTSMMSDDGLNLSVESDVDMSLA